MFDFPVEEPFVYYAICRNQVIALYHKNLRRFIWDLKALYKDLIDNYGIIVIDKDKNILKVLGKPVITKHTNYSDILTFIEGIEITGNSIVRIPESYARLISFNHPENAVFSVNTSTQYHVHTDAQAYIQVGNFTPPLPTITNWQNVFVKNYFEEFALDADALSFDVLTNKDILLPRVPFKINIDGQIKRIYTNFYNGVKVSIKVHFPEILTAKKIEIDVSELSSIAGDSDWYFSNFEMLKSVDVVQTYHNNKYEVTWNVPKGLYTVNMYVDDVLFDTVTMDVIDIIRYVSPEVNSGAVRFEVL